MQPNTSFLGREQLNQTKPLLHPQASQQHTALLQGQAAHTELQEHRALLAVGLPAVQHDTTCNFFSILPKLNHSPEELQTAAPGVPAPLPHQWGNSAGRRSACAHGHSLPPYSLHKQHCCPSLLGSSGCCSFGWRGRKQSSLVADGHRTAFGK